MENHMIFVRFELTSPEAISNENKDCSQEPSQVSQIMKEQKKCSRDHLKLK